MTVVLAMAVLGAIGAPHVLRLGSAPPAVAALLWSSALVLRALTSVFAAIFLVLFFPATQLFDAVTHWCWHTVVPGFTAHLGVSGHNVGDAATLAPVFGLVASSLWVCFGVARGAQSLRRFVRRAGLGSGPGGSVIVGGPDVFVGAAGMTRPRVVVSAGALTILDDEELAAGLAHEHGHIARHHRYVLLAAELCRAIGRPLPGTRTAARELAFHLERDADRWAIARRHDRLALASAICKAALSRSIRPTPARRSRGNPRG